MPGKVDPKARSQSLIGLDAAREPRPETRARRASELTAFFPGTHALEDRSTAASPDTDRPTVASRTGLVTNGEPIKGGAALSNTVGFLAVSDLATLSRTAYRYADALRPVLHDRATVEAISGGNIAAAFAAIRDRLGQGIAPNDLVAHLLAQPWTPKAVENVRAIARECATYVPLVESNLPMRKAFMARRCAGLLACARLFAALDRGLPRGESAQPARNSDTVKDAFVDAVSNEFGIHLVVMRDARVVNFTLDEELPQPLRTELASFAAAPSAVPEGWQREVQGVGGTMMFIQMGQWGARGREALHTADKMVELAERVHDQTPELAGAMHLSFKSLLLAMQTVLGGPHAPIALSERRLAGLPMDTAYVIRLTGHPGAWTLSVDASLNASEPKVEQAVSRLTIGLETTCVSGPNGRAVTVTPRMQVSHGL